MRIFFNVIRNTLRSISLFLLLLVFFTGSTGFTFIRHSCLLSGESAFAAYPEVFPNDVSCCCKTAPVSDPRPEKTLEKEDCCKNIRGFVKLAITGFPVLSFHAPDPTSLPVNPLLFADRPQAAETDWNVRIIRDDPFPPPGGKDLILSIHQIKIPFPFAL